jgi:hypothetical protein
VNARRGSLVAGVVALAACALASGGAPATADCDLADHKVNVYYTTIAADALAELNERRLALGRPPLAIHPELWLRAMWRAARTAASGAAGVSGLDPCPGPAPLLEAHLRRLGPPDGTATILSDPVIVDTGRLDGLLAASTRSVGIGIAYAFSHTISVVYASDAAPANGNEPPRVRGETLSFTPATPPRDLAAALLANARTTRASSTWLPPKPATARRASVAEVSAGSTSSTNRSGATRDRTRSGTPLPTPSVQ